MNQSMNFIRKDCSQPTYLTLLKEIFRSFYPFLQTNTGKGKVPRLGPLFTALQPYRLIVLLTPKGVPSFISRGAAHQRRAAT
jgi:hypothetical protein